MAQSVRVYSQAIRSLANKEVDFDSDTIKLLLLGAGYSPNIDTDRYLSNIVANEIPIVPTTLSAGASAAATSISTVASVPNGTRIVIDAAGANPETRTITAVSGSGPYTLTVAALGSLHASGATVEASKGYTQGGPTLVTKTVTDDATNHREVFDGDDITLINSTIDARYGVLYDATPATNATRPLIALVDFDGVIQSFGGDFNAGWNPLGIFAIGV